MSDVSDLPADQVHSFADVCAFKEGACAAELSALEELLAVIPVAESARSVRASKH